MRYPDYKNYRANPDRPGSKGAFNTVLTIAGILAIIALYSWMDKRDQPQLSVMTYECAPEIEMSMPVRVRS